MKAMVNEKVAAVLLAVAMAAACLPSHAQQRSRIYTCVDATGRTLTSDRPILACNDREQRIIDGVTGHVHGVLAPSYTEAERREIERQEQARQEEQRRVREQRQRERVMLTRFPTERAHEIARENAKQTVQAVIAGTEARLEQLAEQQQRLDVEMEFYESNPDSAPAALRRQIAALKQEQEEQQRFIQGQRAEAARIDAQFDSELEELRRLWSQQ